MKIGDTTKTADGVEVTIVKLVNRNSDWHYRKYQNFSLEGYAAKFCGGNEDKATIEIAKAVEDGLAHIRHQRMIGECADGIYHKVEVPRWFFGSPHVKTLQVENAIDIIDDTNEGPMEYGL